MCPGQSPRSDARRTPIATLEILEVMSDPICWRAYTMINGLGPITGRGLARVLASQDKSVDADVAAVTEAAVLRSLEDLERIGFVEIVDTGEPVARRWRAWQIVPGGFRLDEIGDLDDPVNAAAVARWMRVFVYTTNLILYQWARTEHEWPVQWRDSAVNYDLWMHLTPDQLAEFDRRLYEVRQDYRGVSEANKANNEGSPVYVTVNAVPVRHPDRRIPKSNG